jgi:hypothetical protein
VQHVFWSVAGVQLPKQFPSKTFKEVAPLPLAIVMMPVTMLMTICKGYGDVRQRQARHPLPPYH